MSVTRRDVLRASLLAGGAVLLSPRLYSTAGALGVADAYGTGRASRLFPGERLVHTDLHNHSHLSDGAGEPSWFYSRIRAAGLDVAALTDHSTVAKALSGRDGQGDLLCGDEPRDGSDDPCHSLLALDESDWARAREMADAADADGLFTALAGFEWSSPTVGHSNVWFSRTWTDPLATGGIDVDSSLALIADQTGGTPLEVAEPVVALVRGLVATAEQVAGRDGMAGYFNWLLRAPDSPLGGGSDALFGYNHPGREPGRFAGFRLEPALVDRMVSVEMFNKSDDYLFEGVAAGQDSPLVQVLDAGWKPGILGTSDEHDPNWGEAVGKGKAGLWVRELSRDGVREALEARRFYATREKGLRLDAAANGQRMGTTFGHTSGPILFELDIAQFDVGRNASLALVDRSRANEVPPVGTPGTRLVLQVLQTGRPLPTVVWQEAVTVPGPQQPHLAVEVPIDVTDGTWVLLRLCDPSREADGIPEALADDDPYRLAGRGVAYTSPWYLDPQLPPPAVRRAPGNADATAPGGPLGVQVTRIAGQDRIGTAVAVSRAGFATGTPSAYVAGVDAVADALAAVPAAFADQGPLLLTPADALPDVVAEELARLNPARITLLGGTTAVSAAVEEALADVAPVERLAGEDRYATAVAVSAARFPDGAPTVGVASGEAFADALAAGPSMARQQGPLLLTRPDELPEVVTEEIRRLAPQQAVVFGGPAAVSPAVEAALADLVRSVVRRAGEDRVVTAVAAAQGTAPSAAEALVTGATAVTDALAAGPLAAQRMAPLLLVGDDGVPAATAGELRRLGVRRVTVIGGTAAVDERVEAELRRR